MSDKLKTVVKRSEWLRGKGGIGSGLLRECDGMKCCLGFRELQRGVPASEVSQLRYPMAYMQDEPSAAWMGGAACWNDRTATDDAERETHLAAIFRAAGEEIEFVD